MKARFMPETRTIGVLGRGFNQKSGDGFGYGPGSSSGNGPKIRFGTCPGASFPWILDCFGGDGICSGVAEALFLMAGGWYL